MTSKTIAEGSENDNTKPVVFKSVNGFPYPDLTDRQFEELLYSIFKEDIDSGQYKGRFDSVSLMPGVGEKGRDCLLSVQGNHVGLVQCKKYKRNISPEDVLNEVIKFALYYIKDNSLISDINNFTYYFAVSSGFTESAIRLITNFNNKILEDGIKLALRAKELIKEYKEFKDLDSEIIEEKLKLVLSKLKIEKIIPTDLNYSLTKYPNIAMQFFSVEKVVPYEDIRNLVEKVVNYEEVRRELDTKITNLEPIVFYEIDIREVIFCFCNEVSSINGILEDFNKIDIVKKNEINNLSEPYFNYIQKNSLLYFKKIETFLKDPKNKTYLEQYQNTVAELQHKIIIYRGQYEKFELIIEEIYNRIMDKYSNKLTANRNLVLIFLHYMYWNCDIGDKE
jgi:hypothetical protein